MLDREEAVARGAWVSVELSSFYSSAHVSGQFRWSKSAGSFRGSGVLCLVSLSASLVINLQLRCLSCFLTICPKKPSDVFSGLRCYNIVSLVGCGLQSPLAHQRGLSPTMGEMDARGKALNQISLE